MPESLTPRFCLSSTLPLSPLGSPPLFSGGASAIFDPHLRQKWMAAMDAEEGRTSEIRGDAFCLLSCSQTLHSENRLCLPHQFAKMSTVAANCFSCRKNRKNMALCRIFMSQAYGVQYKVRAICGLRESGADDEISIESFLACTPYAR